MRFRLLRLEIVLFCLAVGAAWTPIPGRAQAAAEAPAFTLTDQLNKSWDRALVFFEVSPEFHGRKDLCLRAPDERSVPFQWVAAGESPNGRNSIAFQSDLPSLGRSVYRLVPGTPASASDLHVAASTDEMLEITNRVTGLRLHRGHGALTEGPIAGVRLPSGAWAGKGKIQSPQAPADCSVKITAAGPVFIDALASYTFPNQGAWQLRFRLVRDEPVILVTEKFNLLADSSYELALGDGFAPDHMFSRDANNANQDELSATNGGTLFLLEPWVHWGRGRGCGNWTSFYRTGGDLLAIGCLDPALWVEPGKTLWSPDVVLRNPDATASFQLHGFARQWLLATLRADDCLTSRKNFAPLPQQVLDKYGEANLDTLKNYTLAWHDTGLAHPRLFVTTNELGKFRAAYRPGPDELDRWRAAPLSIYELDDPVACYLATGDRALGRRLAETALAFTQNAVDLYTRLDAFPTSGYDLPRHYNIVTPAVTLSDLALQAGLLTPEESARLKAQLAFLGCTLADGKVLSPERGYLATANMTTSMRTLLGLIACEIPDHPQSPAWARLATDELGRELGNWTGPNGGWIEAPHYMTVSMDGIMPLALALRGSGLSDVDWTLDPRLRKAVTWLAQISTPPDSRLQGNRSMPAIGNTYTGERTCVPGWMARFWREADPAFAAQMQWLWRQQGSVRTPGLGGAYPGTAGFGRLMFDESIPAITPSWGSESFPNCGAVLRAHFPGDRETYLHFIDGGLHEHYDDDLGSILLWGLGRPLCEEFGYCGHPEAADHSMVEDGSVPGREGGNILEFASITGPGADYVHGRRSGWHRQIMLVKDADALGPNYFIVRDTVTNALPAQWRLWIATDQAPLIANNLTRAKGREDVDLAVFFPAPAAPQITTHQTTRNSAVTGFSAPPDTNAPAALPTTPTSRGRIPEAGPRRSRGADGPDPRATTQYCLQFDLPPGQPASAVLFPVLNSTVMPVFAALADGRGAKITTPAGMDFVFLALEPFDYQDADIRFHGRAGVMQIRPDGIRLSLPAAGSLEYRGQHLENDGRDGKAVSRVIRR